MGLFCILRTGQRASSFHRCPFQCGEDGQEKWMDCFASKENGKCSVLSVGKCQGISCGFYKTREEQARSLEKANERLRSLPEYQQEAIADKYYGGVRKW